MTIQNVKLENVSIFNRNTGRRYAGALKDYGANILMVGISYEKDSSNSNYKKHTCVIEKFRND